MKYPLLIMSRFKSTDRNSIVILTFYPSDSACIKPLADQALIVSYVKYFEPGIELADALSEKGKRRLKIMLSNPSFSNDERRTLGTLYYSLFFGHNPGDDEYKKGGANELYETVCDLYRAVASSEEAWAVACEAAISNIQRLAIEHNA